MAVIAVLSFTACSETDAEEEEYPNWQETNETYFQNVYRQASQSIAGGDDSWKIIRKWSLLPEEATDPTNYVVVRVKEKGTGSGSPSFNDSVRVHYSGRMLPSLTYTDGKVFDSSFTGELDVKTASPVTFGVSQVIDGFSTALQYMHIGDRWEIRIPHQLAYGSTGSKEGTSGKVVIPPYSTLIFDVTLVAYCLPGNTLPDAHAKQFNPWVME